MSDTKPNKFSYIPSPTGEGGDEENLNINLLWDWYKSENLAVEWLQQDFSTGSGDLILSYGPARLKNKT